MQIDHVMIAVCSIISTSPFVVSGLMGFRPPAPLSFAMPSTKRHRLAHTWGVGHAALWLWAE
jgi:hypothetical protein